MKFTLPAAPLAKFSSIIRPLAAFAVAALAHQAQAADYWWDSNGVTAGFGNTTGTWGTSAFWSNSNAGTATPTAATINSADVVNFGTATLSYANSTVGIAAGGVTVNSIIYGTAQSTPINLGTVGNTLTLAGTSPTLTVNNTSATHTLISPVAGSAGLTKAGNGTLVLSGINTYTGGTTVSAGTLGFRNLTSKPASGTHAFAAGTTLGLGVGGSGFTAADVDNAFAGSMTGNLSNVTVDASTSIGIDTTAGNLSYTVPGSPGRGLTKLGTNTLTLNGTHSYTGPTTIAGGALTVNTLANAGASSSIGNFATAGATGLVLSGGTTLNYTGASTTTDRGFTAIGTANTLSVGTGVSLSLGTSVKSEVTSGLTFAASGAGSSVTISSLTITPGSNPDFNITTNTPTVTIQNLNVTGANVIAQRTGTALLNLGNINGTSASGWLSNMNVSGVISGYTGQIVLGADVTLSGLNTFDTSIAVQQGGIYRFNTIKNVSAGASALGAPTTVASGTIAFGNGVNNPIFRYTGTGDTTNRVLNLRGSGTLNLEQAGTGHLQFTANTTADPGNTGAKTLNLTGSTSGTGEFGGAIVEHTTTNRTSVSKSGTGKWTLSGANTYTGTTTINGGTLALGANNVLPNASAVSIGAATLDAATFTDTAGTLAVTAAATINLGSGAALVFADSNAVAWPGTLNITGNLLTSTISFGTSASGLTVAQLGKISVNGSGLGDYSLNSSGSLILNAGPPDTTPPTPSPMAWASVPAAASDSSITMTATTATDASGVEYFFDETSGNPGGSDSGWQSSPSYTDTGLNASTSYTYTVIARDRSVALNATTASASASATTSAAPVSTVWNVQLASQSGNQITTADNFIGAATENTANSTWNRVASLPQTGLILKKSTGENTGVSVDFTGGTIGTQNVLTGDKIFNSRVGGGTTTTLTLKGLTMANSYDIVFYSDWWWRNGDALPITQTTGAGLAGTFFLNRILGGTNGNLPALTRETNPANVDSGAGNVGNWMRVTGLTPTFTGELAFRITDGNNAPFNGFQLIATPIPPKADMLGLSLASNPPSIRDAVFSGTTVTLTVPFGTNVTNLAPTYTLWPGATCTTPSGTARNFTTPQTYTVTSSDSLVTKNYVVTAVIAPPLPEFTLSAPVNWDGRTTITVQPVISNLTQLQANNGTSFTYNWSASNVAVTQTTSPSVMTLTRSQGSGSLLVTLTLNNGTDNVTRSTTITIQEPATDPWVERTPLANEKPVAGQFFARNPFTNLGTIFYRGTQSGTPDDVFIKVYRTPSGGSETLYSTLRQPLASGAYAFTAQIDAGLFTYRVEYGTRTSSVDTVVATVNNLLCGDAFIIEGQSNAQATANDDATANPQVNTSDPWVRTYDASLGWGPGYAKPLSPEWGSKVGYWGMKLAQDIVVQHSMPICLINGALGGTYIAQHQPNPANRTVGTGGYEIYANLLNRVIAARLTHGIRGVFWHQGESDAASFGPPLEPDYLFYEQNFLSISSAWKQDFPNFQRYIMFQIAPNPCSIGPFASEIREVQRQLPRLYSNMSLVNTIAVPGYGGCHYTKAGYESLASRVLPVVNRDFYGVTSPAVVTPPNLVSANFANPARTAITLQFDQPMSWSSFSLPNWFVDDLANQVTSGSASGNTVTLQLSSAAAANSTLDYVKDTWNFGESSSTLLFGANAIHALTFANVPVGALAPYQSWTSSKNLNGLAAAGDADPDNDGVKNAIEYVLGGEPNPANPGSNSNALLPTSTRNGAGDLVFTFKRKLESVGNVELAFRWSADLTFPAIQMLPIGATSSSFDGITVAISTFDATTETIVVTVPAAKAVDGKLFGRLQAATP